ncbi:MAG: NTP transferase domain-containing protein [Austwickia sp.]|nr:NTP transferase domain-containing protein [Austwickia sp.]
MPPSPAQDVAVVVLCGGTSARMGGRDKTRELVGSVSVLELLLNALPDDWAVCCVGQPRPTDRPVLWTRERPAGGGPVAGIDAGLRALASYGGHDRPESAVTVVLAGDQPFAGAVAAALVNALNASRAEAVAAEAGDGRPQLLLAAYRTQRLRQALARGPVTGAGVYATLGSLRVVALPLEPADLVDVDTPAALEAARRRAGRRD